MCAPLISMPSVGASWEIAEESADDLVSSFKSTGKVTQIMQYVLEEKCDLLRKKKANTWEVYDPILIGGDLFSLGYLAFQGTLSLAPTLQGAGSLWATLFCGEIAGLINIGVGCICYKVAKQAWANCAIAKSDEAYALAVRATLDCVCCFLIGAIMIITSLMIKVPAMGVVSAFFAANPWLLPLIFFIATLPLIGELGLRIKAILLSTNLGSKLQLDKLEKLLAEGNWDELERLCSDPAHPLHVEPSIEDVVQLFYEKLKLLKGKKTEEEMVQLYSGNMEQLQIDLGLTKEEIIFQFFSTKMEQLQADMGVIAAIESFALMLDIQNRNPSLAKTHLVAARTKIKEWNRAIFVRMFQQLLYVAGFGVSMQALSPAVDGNLLNGIQNVCLAGANAVPLYMDIFWPFKRNQLIVVPAVESPMALN